MGCGPSSDQQVVQGDAQQPQANNQANNQANELDEDLQLEHGGQRYDKSGNPIGKYDTKEGKPETDQDFFKVAGEEETNEKFMAVKPWIGALVAPSNPPQVNFSEPEQQLKLEYVNGYRSEDSRQTVYWTAWPNVIAYMTAAIGVKIDINTNEQTFYGDGNIKDAQGHNDDIESCHIHPDRKIMATGQRGKDPIICVWDLESNQLLAKMKQGRDTRLVKCLKFSKCGKYIFTADEHNDHNVYVFDWQAGQKIAADKTSTDPVYDMDTGSGNFKMVLAGTRGLKFFAFDGSYIQASRGLFGAAEMVETCSVCFFEDGSKCAAGTVKGDIYLFQGNSCGKTFKGVHQGAIHAMCQLEGKLIASGYTDKTLTVYDPNAFQKQAQYKLSTYARSIDIKDGNLAIGTRDGRLLTIINGQQNEFMNGHGTGETWGLAIHHQTGYIVTTGDDNKILTFDPQKNKVIAQGIVNTKAGVKRKIGGASTLSIYPPNQCSRAAAVNQQNGHVAIATNDGELSVRASCTDLDNIIFFKKIAKEWIEVMKYDPSGKYLAVGSHDNNIYVLDVNQNYAQIANCQKHNSFITNLDWSCDSQYIQSNCGAYEYLFHDAMSGQQKPSGASMLKDEKWATYSVKLGWWVKGIFPPATDGSHINGVDRSNSGLIVATGDDFGFVNLYRNPNDKGSKANSYRAHSSHVVRVQFTPDDSYLYSVGGYDRTLMKWKVI